MKMFSEFISRWPISEAFPRSAAYIAALCLVIIQVSTGIIFKVSQTSRGQYGFSISAGVTLAELFKLVLSSLFFYRECRTTSSKALLHPSYFDLPDSEYSTELQDIVDHSDENPSDSGANSETDVQSVSDGGLLEADMEKCQPLEIEFGWRTVWGNLLTEIDVDLRYRFAILATLYALVNNTIFVSYKLADPGTVILTRSGVTVITAVVMISTIGTEISSIQWLAIIVQVCGLVVSQYNPNSGTTYPITTYFVLFFQVFLTAISGVYNQALLKKGNASLHAQNMVLYAAGVIINAIIHISLKIFKEGEPWFWVGWGSFGAVLVVINQVFIGLAITAVYKHADAIIKCLATAAATGILLLINPIFFGNELNVLVVAGAVVILVSSGIYMNGAVPSLTVAQSTVNSETQGSKSFLQMFDEWLQRYRVLFLGFATLLTVAIVTSLEMAKIGIRPTTSNNFRPVENSFHSSEPVLESPFKNTLGFVRYNSFHPERMNWTDKYRPFFHTIHYSMPHYVLDQPISFHNLTHDSWENQLFPYLQVARTMQVILDGPPGSPESELDGMLYFHFDAWIDPMEFDSENKENIWLAQSGLWGSTFDCFTDNKRYNWFPIDDEHYWQGPALSAMQAMDRMDADYDLNLEEFCVGWSDIYFIPRRLFKDYIFLASMFGGVETFHEIAIPTMIHILDRSRRLHPSIPILTLLGDCWGGCCTENADLHSVQFHRCGHKFNYANPNWATNYHYAKLEGWAGMLGRPAKEPSWRSAEGIDMFRKEDVEAMAQGLKPKPWRFDHVDGAGHPVDAYGHLMTASGLATADDATHDDNVVT